MDTPRTQIWTMARIVALGLIGLTIAGLAYLRFAPDDDAVSVPPGAEVGDLLLEDCVYTTEQGPYQAECGTLVVAEDASDPQARLIALPVTRLPARSDTPGEPIFRLEGGPGQTNMSFPQASRYLDEHDVVLVGYRGVDGSVRLDCPEVETALAHSADLLSDSTFRAYGDAFRSCAERITEEGLDLGSYGLVQQVDDLEAARVALGYDRVNLLSESAGTRTAMIYSWRYPESIHRSVMFGVNPPGNFLWNPKATEEQVGRYAALCSDDPECGERIAEAGWAQPALAEGPERWLFLPIKQGNAKVISFTMMMQSTAEPGFASAAGAFDAWLSASEGDASGLWLASVISDVLVPKMFVWGQYAAAASVDFQASRSYFSDGEEPPASLGREATTFTWGGGRLADAWPETREVEQYGQVRPSEVETLLIGGEMDVSTPPQVATEELLPYLPNGREIVLTGIAHSLSFWNDQPEAGTHLVVTFFDSGRVDDSLFETPPFDFAPSSTGTRLAKMVFAALVGLALIAVVSVLFMARHVRRRGHFGPKSGAVLRSAFPILLGLGGWSLGVLVVLTAMPRVPLDDQLLSVVGVGLPVGLGIYLAWVSRTWSPETKAAGLAAAAAGALIGAWFGFNTVEGFTALLTTVVAAIAGANLILIGLDITRARSRRRTAASPPVELVPEHVRP